MTEQLLIGLLIRKRNFNKDRLQSILFYQWCNSLLQVFQVSGMFQAVRTSIAQVKHLCVVIFNKEGTALVMMAMA
ncbi:hypothetical protein [Flavihumibacter fluvii]|uniref:hypothetical protein n=1 Tax=Flavihumibacter fluvii TaxID=2838157 RepID=UPI001BDF657B|nr:hypothetical protein [Flavihumibacter fluvii]ULQ54644.1 hypothetical protein KJS93_09965 [Flavihumibacter fluvii]